MIHHCTLMRVNNLKITNDIKTITYDNIKKMMLNYDIIPGQRLILVDLAEQLGVSRTPVMHALSILAQEGYLDLVANQGYSVHVLTEEEGRNLFEIREIIETGIIDQLVHKMTDQQFEKLANSKMDFERAISDRVNRKLFILDTEFHACAIEIMDNPILVDRYRDICQKIFLRFRIEDLLVQQIGEIVREHDEILNALRIKDVEYAKELLHNHNKNAQNSLFSAIFQKETARIKIKAQPYESKRALKNGYC